MNYLETTKDFYKEAALEPDKGLCCTTSPVWALPGLTVPSRMLEMNYGFVATGFGTLEVRARRPYRVLDTRRYGVERPIVLESIEMAAIKDPIPDDGPCVFTGRAAIYVGEDEQLDDGAGHVMARDQPLAICDKTAGKLEALGRDDLFVTPPTWFYDGGGCC